MRYVIRTFIAMTLFAFCWVAVGYGINQMLQIGTCASGGPYVSARECPDGIEGLILAVVGGVFLLFVAGGLYMARGRPPGSAEPNGGAVVIWFWTGLFWAIAAGSFLAIWGPGATPGPGGKTGGLIVGFMGVVMGAGGLLALDLPWRRGRRGGFGGTTTRIIGMATKLGGAAAVGDAVEPFDPGPAPAATRAGGDSVARLEALDRLRREGTLTQAEFETLKARILAGEG